MALMGDRIYAAALAVNAAAGEGDLSAYEEASDEFEAALEAFGEAAYDAGSARGYWQASSALKPRPRPVPPGFVAWFAEIRKGGEF